MLLWIKWSIDIVLGAVAVSRDTIATIDFTKFHVIKPTFCIWEGADGVLDRDFISILELVSIVYYLN